MKPRIIRDSFEVAQKVKVGQNFTVDVKYIGEPEPEADWCRNGEVQTILTYGFYATGLYLTCIYTSLHTHHQVTVSLHTRLELISCSWFSLLKTKPRVSFK